MKNIAVYGAGGFGKEVACLINAINEIEPRWNFIGFFDDGKPKGYINEFGSVLGDMEDLNAYDESLAIVMSIGSPSIITKLVSEINNTNVYFPNLIAPDLIFLDKTSFSMGKGNLFMFQSLVSCNVSIGDFNLFNCGVSLGHEVSMGSFNCMMSYVKISGEVSIGNTNFFGVSSVVLQGIKIGNNTTIGTNSVIMRKTKDYLTYLGNPAVEIFKPKM
jgi:sugar O-acyltransferase (sialic acid O-acetyltransferase NeuD family)